METNSEKHLDLSALVKGKSTYSIGYTGHHIINKACNNGRCGLPLFRFYHKSKIVLVNKVSAKGSDFKKLRSFISGAGLTGWKMTFKDHPYYTQGLFGINDKDDLILYDI